MSGSIRHGSAVLQGNSFHIAGGIAQQDRMLIITMEANERASGQERRDDWDWKAQVEESTLNIRREGWSGLSEGEVSAIHHLSRK